MKYGRGDSGETEILGAVKVWKDDPRLDVLGALDELNAVIGLARTMTGYEDLKNVLARIQRMIFKVGSEFASIGTPAFKTYVTMDAVKEIEEIISNYESELPPSRGFIVPYGSVTAATLHLARAIARRAERLAVALRSRYEVGAVALALLNRLSTLLFVLARVVNIRSFIEEEVVSGK